LDADPFGFFSQHGGRVHRLDVDGNAPDAPPWLSAVWSVLGRFGQPFGLAGKWRGARIYESLVFCL